MPIFNPPPFSFKVDRNHDIFKLKAKLDEQNSLKNRCAELANYIFSAVIIPIGLLKILVFISGKIATYKLLPELDRFNLKEKLSLYQTHPTAKLHEEILDIQDLNNHRNQFMANSDNCTSQVTLRTADKVDLNACVIQNPNQKNLLPSSQKWIIYFNGNANCYELQLSELRTIAERTGANLLCANYRGIMDSKGFPTSSTDLIIDGETQVQYLKSLGISTENMLLQGRSLGAAVATEVAANHQEIGQEIHLCNEHGFSTIEEVIKSRTTQVIGSLIGKLIYSAGWTFDSIKSYNKIRGKKIIIHSKEDGVIKYSASLYKGIKIQQMSNEDQRLKKLRIQSKNTLSYPRIKGLYNQSYKPKNNLCLNYSDKNNRAHAIKKYGKSLHCSPLSESGDLFNKYITQVGQALNIPEEFRHQWDLSLFGRFKYMLALGPY